MENEVLYHMDFLVSFPNELKDEDLGEILDTFLEAVEKYQGQSGGGIVICTEDPYTCQDCEITSKVIGDWTWKNRFTKWWQNTLKKIS